MPHTVLAPLEIVPLDAPVFLEHLVMVQWNGGCGTCAFLLWSISVCLCSRPIPSPNFAKLSENLGAPREAILEEASTIWGNLIKGWGCYYCTRLDIVFLQRG